MKLIENLWKGLTILDVVKSTRVSQEELKLPTLTGLQKKLILTFLDDFEDSRLQ
jgi:hypothetical protein